MTSILIVEKGGNLKSLSVKDYQEDELFKKCGFKKEGLTVMNLEKREYECFEKLLRRKSSISPK